MPMTEQQFVEQLVVEVPEAKVVVKEHLLDQEGELLFHLLMADLLRFSVRAFEDAESDVLQRCLTFVDRALREGIDAVVNAVAVSFVENVGHGPSETPAFIDSWPQGLRDEKARQEAWRPL